MLAEEGVVVSAGGSKRVLGLLPQAESLNDGDRLNGWSQALLRTVMHELRTPLTVIRAHSSLALEQASKLSASEIIELFRHIDSSARLVDVIVGDIETLAGQQTVHIRPVTFELAKFLPKIVDDLRALAPGRNLDLVLERKALRLHADPLRLEQVIGDLVENAHKYSRPAGRIRLRAGLAGTQVRLAVEDEGPGVQPEEVERIFEPFYRGSGTSCIRGSGLGLAICKGLVEAQGGGLEAAQAPDGGFQMVMKLPAAA